MLRDITILKGIHSGIILEKELNNRKLSNRNFALSIEEFPQTIGAIINGKMDMNIPLSLKIEKALSLEEGLGSTKKTIVKRIFERGNDREKSEIRRFYGEKTISDIIHSTGDINFNYI